MCFADKCDASYCKNGATCERGDIENPRCVCTEEYEGDDCGSRIGAYPRTAVMFTCQRDDAHRDSSGMSHPPSGHRDEKAYRVPGWYTNVYHSVHYPLGLLVNHVSSSSQCSSLLFSRLEDSNLIQRLLCRKRVNDESRPN